MIDELPQDMIGDMIGNKPTPATEYLFKTDDPDAILLTNKAKSKNSTILLPRHYTSGNKDVRIYN